MSAVLLVAAVSVLGVIAGLFEVSLWSSRIGALSVWASLMLGAVFAALHRGGKVALFRGDGAAVIALLSTCVAGAIVVVLKPFEVWSRAVNGSTDFGRHLIIMRNVAEDGAVDYPGLPRSLHALVAVLWQAADGERYAVGWQTLEGIAWLIVVLMIAASVVAGVRCARMCGVNHSLALAALAAAITVSMILGGWVSAMFADGYMTSLISGLTLVALLSVVFDGDWSTGRQGLIAAGASMVVLANNWPLLIGVAAAVLLVAIALLWKSPKLTFIAWTAISISCIVAAVPLWHLAAAYGFLPNDTGSEVSAAVSNLGSSIGGDAAPPSFWVPEWWWIVVLAGSVIPVLHGFRSRPPTMGLVITALLTSGMLTVVLVWFIGGMRWPDMGYYPFKTLWTVLVLFLPLGLAGLLWSLVWLARVAKRSTSSLLRLFTASVLASTAVLGAAACLGRITASTPLAWVQVGQGLGTASLQIPVVTVAEESLVGSDADSPPQKEGLPWGISPYAQLNTVVDAGYLDLLTSEALEWINLRPWPGLHANLFTRDADFVCESLIDRPKAVRIAGPSPASGIDWLEQAGCPRTIIQPDQWIRAEISDAWFEGLPWYNKPYEYLTWNEYVADQGR